VHDLVCVTGMRYDGEHGVDMRIDVPVALGDERLNTVAADHLAEPCGVRTPCWFSSSAMSSSDIFLSSIPLILIRQP
jgi:hypothetical protein